MAIVNAIWNRMPGWLILAMLALISRSSHALTPVKAGCSKVVIEGEVSSGQEWKSPIGQGWVFRVLPIQPVQSGYSGWDLVVDRSQPAGFPDALLLATLPYNSINEREVGTTFGLRAQDAIGWNPRSFRFLSDPAAFREGQRIFRTLNADAPIPKAASKQTQDKSPNARSLGRLLELQKRASAGEFRILDARLVPGVADPAPFAQTWAMASSRTPHQVEPAASGKSTALGALNWMRFSMTLWLPSGWKAPPQLHSTRSVCPE